MTRSLPLLIIFAILLAGCNLPQGTGPQAWIDAPLDGSRLPLAETEIVFHIFAAGNPKAVELTINGQPVTLAAPALSQPLATVRTAWSPAQPGRYVIVARCQDQKGVWSQPHTHVVVIGEAVITITPTPTLTLTLTPTFTPTITPTFTPTFTPSATPSVTRRPGNVFSNLSLSTDVFYRLDAVPNKVTFTITVNDPAGIKLVEIYFRLRDPNTNETTEWTNEDMHLQGGGVYAYTLTHAHPALQSTAPKAMTLEYQFIVTHPDLSLSRSQIYSDVALK